LFRRTDGDSLSSLDFSLNLSFVLCEVGFSALREASASSFPDKVAFFFLFSASSIFLLIPLGS